MVTAAQASEGITTCDLHAEPIDLAHSTSSASYDAEDTPTQPPKDDSNSESPAPDPSTPTPKPKRRRHTKSRRSDAPRPPDHPSSGSSGQFREPPALLGERKKGPPPLRILPRVINCLPNLHRPSTLFSRTSPSGWSATPRLDDGRDVLMAFWRLVGKVGF